jgi:hypothetical protein
MGTMVLKPESWRTFREVGFNLKNKNVHDYLKVQASELRKICQGTRKSYVWELPGIGKTLKFALVVRKGRFNFSTQTWELIRIDGKINFDPFQKPTPTINFQIDKDEKDIYLENLYPTFPKVSGVDILQFLMTLSYACEFTLSLTDGSDLSASYKLLYGAGFYKNLIKGMGFKTINQNKILLKQDFYRCADYELQNLNPFSRIDETVNSCQEQNISVLDCPVHFLWLGRVIHQNLMLKCSVNYEQAEYNFSKPELEFQITSKDLIRIFNKIPPKSNPVLYPIEKNCTPKEKDFETVKKDVKNIKFFKIAFDWLWLRKIIFGLLIVHTLRGCVTETLNFLWKNECYPN